jgi:hypothetical protein
MIAIGWDELEEFEEIFKYRQAGEGNKKEMERGT